MHVVKSAFIRTFICVALCHSRGAAAIDEVTERSASTGRIADQLPVPDWNGNLTGPMCGIYSSCTALELVGVAANPGDYVASPYIGSCGGSSAAELVRLINDAGAGAHVLSRLSAFDLWMNRDPIVANVRITPTSDRFNHWVVAVWEDGAVVLYDGIESPHKVSLAEFLGNWSGIGIVVTKSQNDSVLPRIWLGRLFLVEIGVLVGIVCLRILRRNRLQFLRLQQPLLRMGIMATICAIGGNAVFGDLGHHTAGVAVATASSAVTNYKEGTLADAEAASNNPKTLLVDARYEDDFEYGTIAGAVNIPVAASQWAIRDYLEPLDRKTPIVVFCQSQRCRFDESVAAQLTNLGFSDVTVCNEGWSEYSKSRKESVK